MTDRELLQQFVQSNSQQAFAELVRRHVGWIHSASVRLVHNPHLAEDVTQAVFIALAQHAKSLNVDKPLSPWLFQVTRYASAKALRSQATHRRHEQKVAAMTPESSSPPAQPDWLQLASMLDDLVARLNQKDRQAVLLRFYERQSFADVGTTLGISEQAARKRTERAVEKLRGMFSRRGVAVASPVVLAASLLTDTTQTANAAMAASMSQSALTAAQQNAAMSQALALSQGAMKMMLFSRMKVAATVTTVIVVAVVAGVGVSQVSHNHEHASASPSAQTTTQPTTAPMAPIVHAGTTGYGPVIERELVGNNSGLSTIDLDTGKLLPGAEKDAYPPTMAGFRGWLKGRGTDAVGAVVDRSLMGFDMVVVAAANDKWDISPADLKRSVSNGKPGFPAVMSSKPGEPTTWLIRTREGGIGVLQVLGLSPNGNAVQFRYKLVEEAASTRPADGK